MLYFHHWIGWHHLIITQHLIKYFKMQSSSILSFHQMYLLSINPIYSRRHIFIQWLKFVTLAYVTGKSPHFSSLLLITLKSRPTIHGTYTLLEIFFKDSHVWYLSSWVHFAYTKVSNSTPSWTWLDSCKVKAYSSSLINLTSNILSLNAYIFPLELVIACCSANFLLYLSNSLVPWKGSIRPTI